MQGLESKFENRSELPCGPNGECDDPENRSWNFNYLGCDIIVYMTVTRCLDNQNNLIVYFEEQDQIVDILSGSCTVDDSFIEGAYREAIRRFMPNVESQMPLCDSGGDPTVTSKQIKLNCRKYCYIPVFTIGEDPGYEWLNCSEEESCCIVTTEWCINSQEEIEGTVISEDQEGDCDGEEETCPYSQHTSPYAPSSSSPECIADRCS